MPVKRILTAAVGAPLLIGAIYAGQAVFTALVTVAVVILSLEFSRLASGAGARPLTVVMTIFAAAVPALFLLADPGAAVLWIIPLVGAVMLAKILDHTGSRLVDLGTTVFGVFYVGFLPSMLILAYRPGLGALPVIMIFLAVWIADTSAYVIGRWLGRTPLAKKLSPNKTIEGALGSVLVTAAVFGSFTFWPGMSAPERVCFGVGLSIAAMFGDLFESALKREAGVKDSGALLPGHGGLLDRVDSLLAAAPLGYFLLTVWLP